MPEIAEDLYQEVSVKRLSVVSALCSAFVLSAAPAQAAPQRPNVNLGAVVESVLDLLQPQGNSEAEPPEPDQPDQLGELERELENLLRVESTAYCLTGTMASGKKVYEGAAAMNGVPLGTKYQIINGPEAGKIYTIEDRISHSSEFDIAYPGDCDAAIEYGRRTIKIERV